MIHPYTGGFAHRSLVALGRSPELGVWQGLLPWHRRNTSAYLMWTITQEGRLSGMTVIPGAGMPFCDVPGPGRTIIRYVR